MSTDNVVIVSGVRTPMGGFQGSLAAVSAPELGAITIAEAIRRAGLLPRDSGRPFSHPFPFPPLCLSAVEVPQVAAWRWRGSGQGIPPPTGMWFSLRMSRAPLGGRAWWRASLHPRQARRPLVLFQRGSSN